MKSLLNFSKLSLLLLLFALGFANQAQAQRYITEKVAKDLTTIAEGVNVVHTFSNGIKLAYEKKGTVESVIAVAQDGQIFQSLNRIPTGGVVATPYTLTLDITASNGCRVKGSVKLFGKNRHFDVDITCPKQP